jgi:transposase
MDDHLRPTALDAAALQKQLVAERARREALEQENRRLRAALARQNLRIAELEREVASLRRQQHQQEQLIAALTEQNTLLREQVAALRDENARLRGVPRAPTPAPTPEVTPATPKRDPKVRKKRAAEHNHGRQQELRPTRWETHAVDTCPQCGETLIDGWVHRRVQVIDLPPVAPLEVTEHRIIRRQCPRCGTRVLPPPISEEAGRIGRSVFGPRLMAAIAVMATVERLPGRQIIERLRREYGLVISHGAICRILRRMADAATPLYAQLQQEARASPVVNADETGWRENGQHTTVWTISTPQVIYVHHGRRSCEEIDGILGADYGGTIVSDCYAAYDHFLGPKQRCWAHLLRDLEKLLLAHPDDGTVGAWVEGIMDLYDQARGERPAAEVGVTPEAERARAQRARRYELLLLHFCPEHLDPACPYAPLAARLRNHVAELFTCVRDPAVPATNNAAERSLRPLVIARKISGGTRSAAGSQTRMILYSVCATARLQQQNPATVCEQVLRTPAAPSPLALPLSTP